MARRQAAPELGALGPRVVGQDKTLRGKTLGPAAHGIRLIAYAVWAPYRANGARYGAHCYIVAFSRGPAGFWGLSFCPGFCPAGAHNPL